LRRKLKLKSKKPKKPSYSAKNQQPQVTAGSIVEVVHTSSQASSSLGSWSTLPSDCDSIPIISIDSDSSSAQYDSSVQYNSSSYFTDSSSGTTIYSNDSDTGSEYSIGEVIRDDALEVSSCACINYIIMSFKYRISNTHPQ